MTDQKPNCNNCTKRKTLTCPIQGEKEYYKIKEYVTVPTGWEVITEVVGCLSHPGAREWLMRDVVKELEQIDLLVPYPQYPHLDLSESLAYIPALNCVRIHEIIALIRGEK